MDNHLEENKFELQGFSLAFHLCILDSVPPLQSRFSKMTMQRVPQPTVTYLCEKYIKTDSPSLEQVTAYENDEQVSFYNCPVSLYFSSLFFYKKTN